MSRNPEILVAKMSGVVKHNGEKYNFARNVTTIHADHPLVKGRESMFRAFEVTYKSVKGESADAEEEKPKAKRGRPKKTEKEETVETLVENGADPEETAKAVAENEGMVPAGDEE